MVLRSGVALNASNYPTDTPDNVDLVVGVEEIAVMLGVEPRSVRQALRRGSVPPAQYRSINGARAWDRTAIVRWAGDTGRLRPTDLALRSEYHLWFGRPARPYIDRRPTGIKETDD